MSHLDSHMGTLQLRPEFFDVYLDLAVEYDLQAAQRAAQAGNRCVSFVRACVNE